MARFTVSVPDGMVKVVEDLQRRWRTTRSGVVVKLLEWYQEGEIEKLMAEGYLAMGEENLREAECSLAAQAEVLLSGPAR